MVKAQKWLNKNYPKNTRSQIRELDISNSDLWGSLKLEGFTNLEKLNCSENELSELDLDNLFNLVELDCSDNFFFENKRYFTEDSDDEISNNGNGLDVSNCPKLTKIKCGGIISKLAYLELGNLPKLTELDCFGGKLDRLDISGCPQIEKLDCSNNELYNLDLSNCLNLTELNCSDNYLRRLDFQYLPNLTSLDCSGNRFEEFDFTNLDHTKLVNLSLTLRNDKFSERDLSCFSHLINLEDLSIKNHSFCYEDEDGEYDQEYIDSCFIGSLKPLENLNKLKKLEIDDKKITGGLEYLSDSLEEYSSCMNDYSWEENKSRKIYKLLEPYGGDIRKWRIANAYLIWEVKRSRKLEEDNPSLEKILITQRQSELENLVIATKNKLGSDLRDLLEELLAKQKEIVNSNNYSPTQKSLLKSLIPIINELDKEVNLNELELVCRKQIEFTQLEKHLSKFQIHKEQIQVPPKSN